jgi:hypothetical protein
LILTLLRCARAIVPSMNPRRQQMAIVLTGAVVLGSGAYALGSQAGDGNADARKTGTARAVRWHDDRGPGLSGLADRLGVDASKLQSALDDLRRNPPAGADPRADFAGVLADALGLSQSKVTAALDTLRAQHEQREKEADAAIAAALAKELGLEAAKVRAALDKARPEPGHLRPPRRDPLATLADELGVSKARLRAAFDDVRVRRAPRPDFGSSHADLAKALGVTTQQLENALTKVRAAEAKRWQARRDAFAQALADKLSLPVQKVKDALPIGPFGDRRAGPHVPGAPPPPGGPGTPPPPGGPGAPGADLHRG